jgi:antitoxin VapB
MAFHIRDAETDALVRKLAAREGLGLTEAVKQAVRDKLEASEVKKPLLDEVREIQQDVRRYRPTGRKADKAFFDELSGD